MKTATIFYLGLLWIVAGIVIGLLDKVGAASLVITVGIVLSWLAPVIAGALNDNDGKGF
jgi:hypothetical protein